MLVFPIEDGKRWTWRLVDPDDRLEVGPAYPTRRHALKAADHLFPELPLEVEGP